MSRFPDPRRTRGDIVAIGADYRAETLLDAYRHGIFPWPNDETPLPWFCPEERALLQFDAIHISRSLARAIGQSSWRYSIDEAFTAVIRECSAVPRPGQDGTWIYPEVIDAYNELHRRGFAHSAEVWEGDELVAGIYGVDSGGAFGGESMFHKRSNASKLALLHLVSHLRSRGLTWMDVQVLTPHMELLGARLVERDEFLDLLRDTQLLGLQLFGEK